MRVDITKPKRAKRGDTVVISLRLPQETATARLGLWSRTSPEFDFSPHIQPSQMEITGERPTMIKPLYWSLHENRKAVKHEIIAEEDCEFLIRQEKDIAKELSAKVKVNCYGKTSQKIRWYLGNAVRFICNYSTYNSREQNRS